VLWRAGCDCRVEGSRGKDDDMHDDTEPAEVEPDIDWEPRRTDFGTILQESVERAQSEPRARASTVCGSRSTGRRA
jgi:hypothetical protein